LAQGRQRVSKTLSFWTVPSEPGETRDMSREILIGAALQRGLTPRV
jgi:hypothetical protein